MEPVILHADLNNFYASVECFYNPELRGKPVAVTGDVEARHGIVLAKNDAAKRFGVRTGNPIWMARRLCPNIVCVPPHYDLYLHYSELARAIYADFTDQVEPFGLDECWLDVTGSVGLLGGGKHIADELRRRIRFELGVTASVGVSFNKVFAKLGSDLKKPDATTVLDQAHFRQRVWPLPVEELIYIGPATQSKLNWRGIHTIGELAQADPSYLKGFLGKNGVMLWAFANGLDHTPVNSLGGGRTIKTIGNSTTAPRDLVTDQDIRITLRVLAESVAERMRAAGFVTRAVQISIRDNTLARYERQAQLTHPTCVSTDLLEAAWRIYRANRPDKPVRSLGLRACNLLVRPAQQLSFLPDAATRQRQEQAEHVVDDVRRRFGHFALQRAAQLADRELSALDPVAEHVIHPEAFLRNK